MKSPKVDYVWVGGFVLAMIVAFMVCMAILSGRTGATDRYYTHFDNVLGVIPGTQLFFEGYPVGRVDAIEPEREPGKKRYRVLLAVEKGWRIPADSVAWITEPSLLAAITIDIHSGSSPELLAPGSDIAGQDLSSVLTAVGSLADEVAALLEEDIRPLLGSVAEATPRILANLEAVTGGLADTTEQVSALFNAKNTARLDGTIGDLSKAAASLDELTATLESSLGRVDHLAQTVDGLVSGNSGQVERMLDDLSHTLASVARHVDTINANLESTSHNVEEFSREIRRNPAVLVRGTSRDDAEVP